MDQVENRAQHRLDFERRRPVHLAVGFTAMSAATGVKYCATPPACPQDATRLALFGVQFGQITLAVIGVTVVANEYAGTPTGRGGRHTRRTPPRQVCHCGVALSNMLNMEQPQAKMPKTPTPSPIHAQIRSTWL